MVSLLQKSSTYLDLLVHDLSIEIKGSFQEDLQNLQDFLNIRMTPFLASSHLLKLHYLRACSQLPAFNLILK